jgi:hypothetical protein
MTRVRSEFETEQKEKENLGIMKLEERPKGIVYHKYETNRGLAERDYNQKCGTREEPITIFEGYWIWWCVVHQQPLAWCEKEKIEKKLSKVMDIPTVRKSVMMTE